MTRNFTSFPTVLQSYQDNGKAVCNGNQLIIFETLSAYQGNQNRAGQCITHQATSRERVWNLLAAGQKVGLSVSLTWV